MSKPRAPRRLPPIPGTTRIVLHGRLRKQFGDYVDWGCPTPANAIYALTVNFPGFRQELAKGAYRIVRGPLRRGLDLDENMLRVRFSDAVREMHIIPVAIGRAKGNAGGIVKIVLGVALIALAVVTAGGGAAAAAPLIGSATAGASTIGGLALGNTLFGVTAGAIGLFGVGLLAGGVGEILSHQPKPPKPNSSFILSGPTNTTDQGGPVPLAYGFKVRVGSVVIASSYEAVALGNGVGLNQGTGNKGGSKQ